MRNGPAFRIVPDLVGNVGKVITMPENPIQLYVDAGIETVRMACSVFELIMTRKNTKSLEKKLELVKAERLKNLSQERVDELELKYEQVRQSIEEKCFSHENVRSFIGLLQEDIWQIGESIKSLDMNPEDPLWDEVQEMSLSFALHGR